MIKARRVRFDWEATPLHWVPGDAFTTHVINVLHLLLPAGERWFCDVFRQALPLVHDDGLREDVKGFIGQEAVHARAHSVVLDHLAAQGLDTRGYTRGIDWMFNWLLGDHGLNLQDGHGPRWVRRYWLAFRLAMVAAIEHFTCVLGYWVIHDAQALDAAGADATMLDLLRWHGAEEVEHRSVAFDLYQHVSRPPVRYIRRIAALAVVQPVIMFLWIVGAHYLVAHDPEAGRGDKPSVRRFIRVSRRTGRLPTVGYMARKIMQYLWWDHHPSFEASTDEALAYIARSPAARSYADGRG
ncbi:MAG TPA: metal-dependent hydrolase [Acidimicrobiales bacterium]|nr:metal-dependent hydrolase [Acidimicrobiales bacterium]